MMEMLFRQHGAIPFAIFNLHSNVAKFIGHQQMAYALLKSDYAGSRESLINNNMC
jgi:hypothetical protein